MPKFGKKSSERLAQVDHRLVAVLDEAIRHYDFTVLCGYRGKEEQNQAVAEGASKLPWPRSPHNKTPARAVDIAPYPIDWDNENEFYYLAGLIMGIASQMGVKIEWGGRWEELHDTPHFELDE